MMPGIDITLATQNTFAALYKINIIRGIHEGRLTDGTLENVIQKHFLAQLDAHTVSDCKDFV